MTATMVAGLHVLLVEDNPADARLVRENLADVGVGVGGVRVSHVTRLADVMPMVEAGEPDCILLDLGLPDADGLEAVSILLKRVPHIPIIVLTGHEDESLGAAAVNLGAQDYLTKSHAAPIVLARTLRYAIERSGWTDALRRSEEAYRLAFASHPDPVLVYDCETLTILAANDTAGNAYRCAGDELLRASIVDLVVPDDRDQFVAALAALPSAPTVVPGAWRHRRRDGHEFLVQVSSSAVVFGRRPARMTVVSDVSERERAISELRASEERYRTIVETASEGVWVVDADLLTTFVNERMAQMVGYAPEEMLGQSMVSFIAADDDFVRHLRSHADAPRDTRDVRFVRNDGADLWGLVASSPLHDKSGRRSGFTSMVTDLTERRRAQESLRQSAAIVESSDDAMLAYDLDGTVLAWNPGAERMFGYTSVEMLGRDVSVLGAPGGEAEFGHMLERVGRGERVEHGQTHRRRRDGTTLPVSVKAGPIVDQAGRVTAAAVVVRDVTDRCNLEDELRRQALHDSLTGLPNRTLILDRLEQALSRSARTGDYVAVLFLDLDRFKTVNDSQGHSRGDELLVLVTARLANAVRAGDTVARLGGDEFVVVCEGVENSGDVAQHVAERITAELAEPFLLGTTEVAMTASIGIALGAAGDVADDVLRDADAAMYQAKERGRARAELFDEAMRVTAERRLAMAASLRRATTEMQFCLEYQAIVSLKDDRIVGAEALVRWDDPDHGRMSPAEFVPLAEETGLIVPIGRWVLEEACRRLHEWTALVPDLTMSVNVSPRQLALGEFFDTVTSSIAAASIRPASLILEITEGVLMENVDASLAALVGLRAAGVSLAVDDFGTGYSSLSYLKRLPLDVLKIDRAFVKGLPADAHDSAIVTAITALAGTFGLKVVAEGVETCGQASALTELGCAKAQGFYFARPVPAAAFRELLRRQVDKDVGLPYVGHSSQAAPTSPAPEVTSPGGLPIRAPRLRYRTCAACGRKGAYAVPGRPAIRCKYCSAFASLSMAERALAELDSQPFVDRLRGHGQGPWTSRG